MLQAPQAFQLIVYDFDDMNLGFGAMCYSSYINAATLRGW